EARPHHGRQLHQQTAALQAARARADHRDQETLRRQNLSHRRHATSKGVKAMLIVDSQVHIWAASTPERPWPARPAVPHRTIPYSADDLIKDMVEGGVDRAVIVP